MPHEKAPSSLQGSQRHNGYGGTQGGMDLKAQKICQALLLYKARPRQHNGYGGGRLGCWTRGTIGLKALKICQALFLYKAHNKNSGYGGGRPGCWTQEV